MLHMTRPWLLNSSLRGYAEHKAKQQKDVNKYQLVQNVE